jgi:hypothetical protein
MPNKERTKRLRERGVYREYSRKRAKRIRTQPWFIRRSEKKKWIKVINVAKPRNFEELTEILNKSIPPDQPRYNQYEVRTKFEAYKLSKDLFKDVAAQLQTWQRAYDLYTQSVPPEDISDTERYYHTKNHPIDLFPMSETLKSVAAKLGVTKPAASLYIKNHFNRKFHDTHLPRPQLTRELQHIRIMHVLALEQGQQLIHKWMIREIAYLTNVPTYVVNHYMSRVYNAINEGTLEV